MGLCSKISRTQPISLNSVILFPELLLSPISKTTPDSLVTKTNSSDVVLFGEHRIKETVSSTLETIFDKYGDITSNSRIQSLTTRTYLLETLATVVIELQSTPLRLLSDTRAEEMLEVVKDIETAKIRVDWLKPVLEEVLEATRRFKGWEKVVKEKEACDRDRLLAKQEMEVRVKEMKVKEEEMKEFKERLITVTGKLGSLEMKRTVLDKRFVFLRSKVEKFEGKSVFKDVL